MLEANPDYWGGRVDFDRLIVRALPEMALRVAALLKGEVDLITQVPPDQGERVKGNAGTVVSGALYGGLYVLAVNSKRPPLDNPLVKQALSLAIDRESIVKELWRGRGVVPSGMIAKGDNHFDASLPPLAFNPTEAKARLKKAGYKGEEVVIETTVGYMAGDKPMAEAIQAMWRDVGVNSKVEVMDTRSAPEDPREELQGALVVGSHLDLARSRRHDVAAPRAGRSAGLLAPSGVRRAGRRRAVLGRRSSAPTRTRK